MSTHRWFFRSTQNHPTTGGAIYDLMLDMGEDVSLGSQGNEESDFLTTIQWRAPMEGANIIGTIPTSLEIINVTGTTEYRWRVNRLDAAGAIQAFSEWSTEQTGTGVKTQTLSAPNGDAYDFIEIEFQSRRSGGMPVNNSVTIEVSDPNSFIDVEVQEALEPTEGNWSDPADATTEALAGNWADPADALTDALAGDWSAHADALAPDEGDYQTSRPTSIIEIGAWRTHDDLATGFETLLADESTATYIKRVSV